MNGSSGSTDQFFPEGTDDFDKPIEPARREMRRETMGVSAEPLVVRRHIDKRLERNSGENIAV